MKRIFLSLLLCANMAFAADPVGTKYATGLLKDGHVEDFATHFAPKQTGNIPENFSWEEKGFATPVRNQGQCGSCWAFGSTQMIEMGYKIFHGKNIDFSEQELVGKLFYGCGGGYFAGDYQVEYGQTDEASCPYEADNSQCSSDVKPIGKGISTGAVGEQGQSPTVAQMQAAIMTYGAIAVTVGANGSFMNYRGGLSKSCPRVGTNHIVALTGWKTVNGKVYFHLKNSWGTGWGEKGYGWFQLGCYNLAEEAAYLQVK